jgi:hypothetical protein
LGKGNFFKFFSKSLDLAEIGGVFLKNIGCSLNLMIENLQDQLFVSLHSTQKYSHIMQSSATGKVLEEKIETCTCDLSVNLVFQ